MKTGKCRRVTVTTDVTCHVMTQERGKTSLQCTSGGQRLGIVSVVIRNAPKQCGDWRRFSF